MKIARLTPDATAVAEVFDASDAWLPDLRAAKNPRADLLREFIETARPDGPAESEDEITDLTVTRTWTATLAPLVPITRKQLRKALHAAGLLATVEAAAKAAGGDVLIEFEDSGTYERTHPFVDQLATALQLAPETVDALWRTAATL